MDAPLLRLAVAPSERNGLRSTSYLMVDKITTVPRARLGALIGRVDDTDMVRLGQAALVFLGLGAAAPERAPA